MARTLSEASRRLKRPGILLTDDLRLPDPSPHLKRLPRGSLVILRRRDARARMGLAQSLRPATRALGLKLVIAADQGLALAARAEGVHIPEFQAKRHDLARLRLWRHAHPDRMLTTAAHSPQAIRAARLWVDLILISPVFATESHRGQRALGPLTYRLWTRSLHHGIAPLGGITPVTYKQLKGAKIAAIAAIGGWLD